jgi:DNA polymerase alpha subunit A
MAALDRLKEIQGGNVRPLDQYKAQEDMPIFEEIDNEEYERRKEARKNDDFIVDDDGFGYVDRGGEIWEYEDH